MVFFQIIGPISLEIMQISHILAQKELKTAVLEQIWVIIDDLLKYRGFSPNGTFLQNSRIYHYFGSISGFQAIIIEIVKILLAAEICPIIRQSSHIGGHNVPNWQLISASMRTYQQHICPRSQRIFLRMAQDLHALMRQDDA